MIDLSKVRKIAREVAKANLTSKNVVDVLTEATADSEGRDAVGITFVLKPGAATRISGDAALDTLVQLHTRLDQAGEGRIPIVEYATEDELAESGDS
jgi:hypothetical protein